jgi:hypothetical protein
MGSAQEVFDFWNNRNSTTTREVVVERPVIKEVEADCPPCPDCEEQVINVETLTIKGDGDILVKGKNNSAVENNAWIFGDACEIHTPQEITQGKYAVTSIYNILPSHFPPTFHHNSKYPKNCNERNYRFDKSEQGKVIKYANNFKPQFLINDDNTPANGTIITDRGGIVLGGNGRTMILLAVIEDAPAKYKSYYNLLLKKCNNFGISFESIKNIDVPVLVRVIETDKNKNCNYYSRIFNENMNNKLDDLALAISYIKSLGTTEISRVSRQIASAISHFSKQATKKAGLLFDSSHQINLYCRHILVAKLQMQFVWQLY